MRMRKLSIPLKISGAILGAVVILMMICVGQVKNSTTQTPSPAGAKEAPQPDIPLCNGASTGSSAASAPAPVNPHPHSVTLSWKPVVPATTSPADAIKGYYVYRSFTSHTYVESNRMSDLPLRSTRCVDTTVESRKTYFYMVKAVTERGKQSEASIEIKAVVPFP
jgi:hypothetical protein